MEFKLITIRAEWHPQEILPSAPFTQAYNYGEWQSALKRKVFRYIVEKQGETAAFLQVIKYPLAAGRTYLYAPYGPVVRPDCLTRELFQFIRDSMKPILAQENAVFFRLDISPLMPSQQVNEMLRGVFKKAPMSRHSSSFQPRDEWILDLRLTEPELLAAMHQKTRYNINFAERHGVTSQIISQDLGHKFDDFYELMHATAQRDHFHLHSKKYYQKIFDEARGSDDVFLALSSFGKKTLAVNLIVGFGTTANFVFGGASDSQRNLMAPYVAHWAAIKQAKKMGYAFYNFGVVSTDTRPNPAWDGFSTFKRRFGGSVLSHTDLYDYVAQPLWYNAYNIRNAILRR